MQGLWKQNLGKNFYSKDCKIKNNKRKHFLKAKSKAVMKKSETISNGLYVKIFNEKRIKENYIEILDKYMSVISVPVIETKLRLLNPTNFNFDKCITCDLSKDNMGKCNLFKYKRYFLYENNFLCEKYNEPISHKEEFKTKKVYYDFFSEEKGFRDYYTNKLIMELSHNRRLISYYRHTYDKWTVKYKKEKFNGIEFPVAIGVDIKNTIIRKEIEITKYRRMDQPVSEKDFFYGYPIDINFNDKYYTYNRKFCQTLANRKLRSKSKHWVKRIKKDPEIYYEEYQKTASYEKSIAWCVT